MESCRSIERLRGKKKKMVIFTTEIFCKFSKTGSIFKNMCAFGDTFSVGVQRTDDSVVTHSHTQSAV